MENIKFRIFGYFQAMQKNVTNLKIQINKFGFHFCLLYYTIFMAWHMECQIIHLLYSMKIIHQNHFHLLQNYLQQLQNHLKTKHSSHAMEKYHLISQRAGS